MGRHPDGDQQVARQGRRGKNSATHAPRTDERRGPRVLQDDRGRHARDREQDERPDVHDEPEPRIKESRDPSEDDPMERKDRHERPAQIGERRHVEDQDPRLRGGKRVILDRQDDDRGENEDEREEERPPRDPAVVIVRLTGPQVSESDPQIRPRGHVEDDGDPREEEVEVDRAHVRHRDNPPTGCEGRPEDGATQAEGDSPALQVPGPEGAARGRARVGEESRHGHGGIVLPTSIRLLTQRAPR